MTMGTSAGPETQEEEETEKVRPSCILFYAKRSVFLLAPALMQVLCPEGSCDAPPNKERVT